LLALFLWVGASLWVRLSPTQEVSLPSPATYEPFLDDYVVYWVAGNMVLDGRTEQLYDLDAIKSAEASAIGRPEDEILLLPYYNPPFVAALFAPLALLPLKASALLFTAVMLATLLAALLVILKRLDNPLEIGLWTAGVLSSLPVFYAVGHGQFSFLVLLIFTATYLLLKKGSDRWAGAMLALLLMKPHLVLLPLLILAYKRRTTALRGFVLGAGALAGLSLLVAGPSFVVDYPRLLLNATTWDDDAGILTWAMYGWNAFFRGILGPEDYGLIGITHLVASLATAWLCLGSWRGEWQPASRDFDLRFAILVMCVLLTSPHLYGQDLIIGVLPGALVYMRWQNHRRLLVAALLLTSWFLLYFHFLLLTSSSLNLVTLAMAVALLSCYAVLPRRARQTNEERIPKASSSPPLEAVADVS